VRPILLLPALAWLAVAALAPAPAGASTITLFSEDFDGYTSFPNQIPSGDHVNPGLPLVSEGADGTWYGIRFQGTGSTASSIDADIAVQKYGDSFDGQGPGNQTPVGRFEDDAGIAFVVSTVGVTDVLLDFDWRTFSTSSSDRVRVGYFATNTPISFTSYAGGGYLDARTGTYSWPNWTEVLNGGQQGTFQHESFSLPSGFSYVYVAFWLDNGEGDYGKIDNVLVTAVPEPGTLALVALGTAGLAALRRRS
jgi:PEP-CTERM motif